MILFLLIQDVMFILDVLCFFFFLASICLVINRGKKNVISTEYYMITSAFGNPGFIGHAEY